MNEEELNKNELSLLVDQDGNEIKQLTYDDIPEPRFMRDKDLGPNTVTVSISDDILTVSVITSELTIGGTKTMVKKIIEELRGK